LLDFQMKESVLIRGGGDLASGVALRLHRSGLRVVITELAQPLVIRRTVSFAEAIYQGEIQVEGVTAQRVHSFAGIQDSWEEGVIPVLIDPDCTILKEMDQSSGQISILVDGRMAKSPPNLDLDSASLVVGLGPGFVAGENCHAVIETNRGHFLGRVIWEGSAQPNTGVPEGFGNQYRDRVLRSPVDGLFQSHAEICDHLDVGDLIAEVNGHQILAPFKGVLRGLLHSGLHVNKGLKIGDLDPRDDPSYCTFVSDKSLAIAGGVLEAILASRTPRQETGG
jgi:xanthine dehydrogenase accessory factor